MLTKSENEILLLGIPFQNTNKPSLIYKTKDSRGLH